MTDEDRFVIIECRDTPTASYWWEFMRDCRGAPTASYWWAFMRDWANKKSGIKAIWLARPGDWIPGFNNKP